MSGETSTTVTVCSGSLPRINYHAVHRKPKDGSIIVPFVRPQSEPIRILLLSYALVERLGLVLSNEVTSTDPKDLRYVSCVYSTCV